VEISLQLAYPNLLGTKGYVVVVVVDLSPAVLPRINCIATLLLV
jgi:hypothetical protein